MKKLFVVLFTQFIGCHFINGQHNSAVDSTAFEKTIVLDEIAIPSTRLTKYATGIKTKKISLSSFSAFNETLSKQASIQFKNYGNDQLSTIAFRGTTASQTALLWNGFEANSPTLGLTDFSTWPTYLLDDVNVQYGSTSPNNGSSAIGGTVLINQNTPVFNDNTSANILFKIGSFGRYETGITFKKSSRSFIAETKLFGKRLNNNFTYQVGDMTYTQINAEVAQYGIKQNLHYKIDGYSTLSFEGIYTANDRSNQPPKKSNVSTTSQHQNLRLALKFKKEKGQYSFLSNLGFLTDDFLYDETSRTTTQQYAWRNEMDLTLSSKADLKTGFIVSHYRAFADNYPENTSETRTGIYSAFKFVFSPLYNISLNFRQDFYPGNKAPFSPSFGHELKLIRTNKHTFAIKNSISKSYRIPTLNDRYWQPGGNPDLSAEQGWNLEAGLHWKFQSSKISIEHEITGYKNWIEDMIIWTNTGSFWTPSNLMRVNVSGLEAAITAKMQLNAVQLKSDFNYSITKSINQLPSNPKDPSFEKSQLPYIPVHAGSFQLATLWKKWTLQGGLTSTGLRYTNLSNDSFNSIAPFSLIDLVLSKELELKNHKLSIDVQAKNVTNVSYENYKNYAQPGINYSLSIQLNFN